MAASLAMATFAGAAPIYPVADGTLVDGGSYGPFDGIPDNSDWYFNSSSYEGAITLGTASPESSIEHRLVWEYNLQGVSLVPPVSATLTFTIRAAPIWPMPDVVVNVYAYPADLLESDSDFHAAPAVYQGRVVAVPYEPPAEWVVYVTDVVNEALTSGSNMVAFRFQIDPDTQSVTSQAFVDAVESDPSTKPFLTITAADCDDGNACTADTFVGGLCEHQDDTPPGSCCDPLTGDVEPIDDGNPCTDDSCDAGGIVVHTPLAYGTPCDDDSTCTANDVCNGDEAGTCQGEWCVLDLDASGVMGTGDFALFAACFGACYPPADPCLVSNFDDDSEGCVGTSDFAAFVGCFGLTCDACAGCAGPEQGGTLDSVASASSRRDALAPASIGVVARKTPSVADVAGTLPRSIRSLAVGEDFFLEVWATRGEFGVTNSNGLAAAYVDLTYDPESLRINNITPGGRLGIFSGGVPRGDGLVTALGGCANLGETVLGTGGMWVRTATLAMRAKAAGKTSVRTGPSDRTHGVAVVGEFANIDPGQIDFGHTGLVVHGRPRPTDR